MSIRSYLSHKASDLVLLVVISVIALLATLLGLDNQLVRVILGLPLVFVAPGYAITAAVFPEKTLEPVERILLTLGLSLSVVILGGLVLDWTPWGLQVRSWAMLLCAVVVGASGIAVVRRRQRDGATTIPVIGLSMAQVALVGLAAVLFAVAIAVARTPAPPQGIQGYSLLWIVPVDGTDDRTVRVGFSSSELASTTYRLRLEVDGHVLHEWSSIALRPGETWEQNIDLPPADHAKQPVEALLYRLDAPTEVYRRVIYGL